MKFTLLFLTSYAMKIPLSKSFHQAITAMLPSYENLTNHGCHCSSEKVHSSVIPVDTIDAICKEWLVKRECIKKKGGTCFNKSAGMYTFKKQECKNPDGSCAKDMCELDYFMATKLYNQIMQTGFVLKVNVNCNLEVRNTGFGKGSGFDSYKFIQMMEVDKNDIRCCGEVPHVYTYSSKRHECVFGTLLTTIRD